MKLHTVFITYNRLELTKQAIESYEQTVTLPHTICVVDNKSTDGTIEWLKEQELVGRFDVLYLTRNKYPGYACNYGWKRAPDDATHLQRCDNDFRFLAGWCEEIEERFQDPTLGQLGLRTDEEEHYVRVNCGGMCIIRRELWDKGLRWQERPWGEYPPGYAECAFFSVEVTQMGYHWGRAKKHIVENMASGNWDDPYYAESYAIRGIRRPPDSAPGTT